MIYSVRKQREPSENVYVDGPFRELYEACEHADRLRSEGWYRVCVWRGMTRRAT